MYIYTVQAIDKTSGKEILDYFADVSNPYYRMALSYVHLCRDGESKQDALAFADRLFEYGWDKIVIEKAYPYKDSWREVRAKRSNPISE